MKTWKLILLAAFPLACSTTSLKPPPVLPPLTKSAMIVMIRDGSRLGCTALIPPEDRPAAREILKQVISVGQTDPQAAYNLLVDQGNAVPIAAIWGVVHGVLDLLVPSAGQWTEIAVEAAVPAAEGCLAGIGAA